MDKPWKVACGKALVGGLWKSLERWPVDKLLYVAGGQALVQALVTHRQVLLDGLWTSLGR